MALDKDTIQSLVRAGIGFYVNVRVPAGGRDILLSPDDVEKYVEDKVGATASLFRATRDEYLAWVESDGNVQCSARTASGHRCRNFISGGGQMEMDEWKKAQGGYCAVHGGIGGRKG
ncbi:hypothetical protein [Ciceribacter sp. RN22]|uniref:hypothetical protein n=1 Tax=Ciceribacter sp. RN22 TaxID=2954932 RepID=UPI0020934352|nr:hypothetical protein [Ciceribacter sp. RN22]MCO6178811.1 hypothetical protein [Ciceribacter sp. RN22]